MSLPSPVLPPVVTDASLFQEFLEHWHALRGDELMPERKDLSLVDGGAFTHWLTIFEHRPEGDARFWYVGPERSALSSDEMSGANLAAALPASLRAVLVTEMKDSRQRPCGRLSRIHGMVHDIPTMTETLVLPLRNIAGEPTFAAALTQLSPRPAEIFAMRDFFSSAHRLEILTIDIGDGVSTSRYEAILSS